jgi:hypothetical protein
VHVLVKCRSTAEESPIVHAHVTGQQTIIRDDDVVPDRAIVANVSACHEKIFVADIGGATLRTTPVNSAVFANDIVVSDLNLRFSFRRERKVLRRRANNGAMSNKIARADRDISLYDNVRLYDCVVTDNGLRPDYREWTDLDIGSDLRIGIDKCRRMNLQSTPASLKLK